MKTVIIIPAPKAASEDEPVDLDDAGETLAAGAPGEHGLGLSVADRLNAGANDLGHESRRVEHESQ